MRIMFLLAAATLFVSGCGGGGGPSGPDPPVAMEKPIDVWEGMAYHDDGSEYVTKCLVTPGFDMLCNEGGDRTIKGKLDSYDRNDFTVKYDWTDQFGQTPAGLAKASGKASNQGSGNMKCLWSAHDGVDCDFHGEGDAGDVDTGHVTLSHRHESKGRPLSGCLLWRRATQAQVGAAWRDYDSVIPMLSVDSVGRAFGQSANLGCYWTGTLENQFDLDPTIGNYNLFKVALLMEGCTDPALAAYNGKTFRGFAYMDDTQLRIDTLVMKLTTKAPPGGLVAINARFRRQ